MGDWPLLSEEVGVETTMRVFVGFDLLFAEFSGFW